MRIIIIGAGNTGFNLTAKFCTENHDIVVIDTDGEKLEAVASQFDVLTLQGEGSNPQLLEEAQLAKADMLVAVTSRDEINILACAIAATMGVKYKIARVSNTQLLHYKKFNLQSLGVDLAINQKEECARELFNIIRMPGAMEVIDIQDGRIFAVGLTVPEDCPITQGTLSSFWGQEWINSIRVIGIMRGEAMTVPRGNTTVEPGDEVYFVGRPDDCLTFISWLRPNYKPFQKVIIAGGGDTGIHLASWLEKSNFQTVLLEQDADRAHICSGELHKTVVINDDALNRDVLEDISMKNKTAFVAVTGDDESNIISCLLASKQGADFTMARVNKPKYAPVINSLHLLDRTVSSHQSMVNSILHFIRGKHIKSAFVMHKLPGELLDVVITERSPWVNTQISKLKIPRGAIIATISRNNEIHTATGDFVILSGDRLVIFAIPQAMSKIQTIISR
ncbi:MAG: Trk system potassium transporter TrkA [Spartobacteria bacterium]|nr:Trk system potassium transporter TrkA [Spartobacteria bacterium]